MSNGQSAVELMHQSSSDNQQYTGSKNPLPTRDASHQYIHEGRVWYTNKLWSGAEDIANAATVYFLIVVPENLRPHFLHSAAFSGKAELCLYRSPTVSDNGTPQAIHNRRDDLDGTGTNMLVYHTPTVTDVGTLKDCLLIPGGTGHKATGDDAGYEKEIVLVDNTTYLVALTNTSGAANSGWLGVDWYEPHTN